jgi:hypothetical protein
LKLNNFRLNVQVEELQQYGDQLLGHWIRRNKTINHKTSDEYYKNPDYQAIIQYTTDHRSNNNHMLSNNNCSSNVLFTTEKSVSEKYDTITPC